MDSEDTRVDGGITYVRVHNAGALKLEAKINTEDYQRLICNGVNGRWYLNADQRVAAKDKGKYTQVARLILGLDKTMWATIKDKDPLNLLRDNLVAKPAGWPAKEKASRRAVDKIIGRID